MYEYDADGGERGETSTEPTVAADGDERVRVELESGYNYVGTVVDERLDRHGRKLVVEDTQGNERVARLYEPGVEVVDVANERRSRRGRRL